MIDVVVVDDNDVDNADAPVTDAPPNGPVTIGIVDAPPVPTGTETIVDNADAPPPPPVPDAAAAFKVFKQSVILVDKVVNAAPAEPVSLEIVSNTLPTSIDAVTGTVVTVAI